MKKGMKSLAVVLCLFIVVLSFAACQTAETGTSPTNSKVSGGSASPITETTTQPTPTPTPTQSQTQGEQITMLTSLQDGAWNYSGYVSDTVKYIEDRQLLKKRVWASFVEHFRDQEDGNGNGWRGEYWGKLMRGAASVYSYTQNEELYTVLETTTKDLLTTQDGEGRISSYTKETELKGWDMWCRKYVLVGLQSFYEICKDESLKKEMLTAMEKHTDYILSKVGPEEEGKTPITNTSEQWGGLNSSSILEPIMWLYNETKDQKYLDFAKHIVDCGGSTLGNIVELAYEGDLKPYQYPVTKAYEMTSFFEGLLEYYRVTGEEKYLTAVVNYAYGLLESDITIIGCAGCAHELLNNAVVQQTNPAYTGLMQETCVTVTWMRFCYQVLTATNDSVFADTFETSMYNALLGAVNTNRSGLPFDGYLPLLINTKGRATGGACGNYGCCASYGASGLGAIAPMSTMADAKGICVNLYLPGTVSTKTPTGSSLVLEYVTNYPVKEQVAIKVNPENEETFSIFLRIPAWSSATQVTINGTKVEGVTAGTYLALTRSWKAGDEIVITLDMRARAVSAVQDSGIENVEKHVALIRGPIVLARDARLGERVDEAVNLAVDENGYVDLKVSSTATFDCHMQFEVPLANGGKIHMIDYASAGATWSMESLMTAWLPTEAYWTSELTKPIVASNSSTSKCVQVVNDMLEKGETVSAGTDLTKYTWELEDAGDSYYRIYVPSEGGYLTISSSNSDADGARIVVADKANSDLQLWKLEGVVKNTYRITSKFNNKVISEAGDSNNVHMWHDMGIDGQRWNLLNVE